MEEGEVSLRVISGMSDRACARARDAGERWG